MSVISLDKTRSVSFKNEQLSCTFLKIDSLDINQVSNELMNLTASAPKLLNSLPLILDCRISDAVSPETVNDFFKHLNQLDLNIVGLIDNEIINNVQAPWPIIAGSKKEKAKSIANLKTKVIEYRVRSGEIIEANDAHLIILGSVGSGAEIYASGNIYVYGSLHGRAFAGMNGALDAFIVAQSIEAEMLAIAGIYTINQDSNQNYNGYLKVYLEDSSLNFKQLK